MSDLPPEDPELSVDEYIAAQRRAIEREFEKADDEETKDDDE